MLPAERLEYVRHHRLDAEGQPRHATGAVGSQLFGRDGFGVALDRDLGTRGEAYAVRDRLQYRQKELRRQQRRGASPEEH
jgi:hypothetical protein